MVDTTTFGFNELLTLAQTIGIVGTMVITMYFSWKQNRSVAKDTETRVMNDLDEKMHRLGELFIGKPEMLRVVAAPSSVSNPEQVVSYYVSFMCSHAYHMRERKIISDNDWIGWLQWMKNAFAQGTIKRYWITLKIGNWFDPKFRDFIDNEIIMTSVK